METVTNNLKVSDKTASYVSVLKQIDSLWTAIYEAHEKHYGAGADESFNSLYKGHLENLQKAVEESLIISIDENLKEENII